MELSGYASQILNLVIMIISVILLLAFIWGGMYLYFKWKRYREYTCIIWSRDGFNNVVESSDMAGVFVDKKTKNKRLFMKKNNIGLSPDNIPYVLNGNKKVIYLLQIGLKNFRYIKPNINSDGLKFDVGEEDVNWAINAYERQKAAFINNKLLQFMPYIALGLVSFVILIIFIYLFKNMGVLADVARSFDEAAKSFAQAKAGTVVLN